MKKYLIVYYSQNGATAGAARQLAQMLGADVEEIHERRPRHKLLAGLSRLYEALTGREPPIEAPVQDPARYRCVIVGSPVWAGHVSSPVRSYLVANGDAIRELALFCTCAHAGAQALADMASLCDRMPCATLLLTSEDLALGTSQKFGEFARDLRAGLRRRRAVPRSTAVVQAA